MDQVVLTQWDALVSLAKQLYEFASFILAWRLLFYRKRILGLVEICPVDGAIHHSRREALNESLSAGQNIVFQERDNLLCALNGGAICDRSNTVELHPPTRITLSLHRH